MKPIQVMIDLELLKELDETEEVAELGRSAVMRRAVAQYLERRRRADIRRRYQEAYREHPGELTGWEDEGSWPD